MSMLTEEVSKQKMLETIHYMTENFPYRWPEVHVKRQPHGM